MPFLLLQNISDQVYTILTAVVILLIGFIGGTIARNVLNKILREIEADRATRKMGLRFSVETGIGPLVGYVIYVITVIVFFNHLGLASYILYLIAGVVLLLVVLTAALWLREIIPNSLAGFSIQKKHRLVPGKHLQIDSLQGTIKNVHLAEIELKTKSGDVLHVPWLLLKKAKTIQR